MTYEIRKIHVWSVMKVAFVIFGVLGLIVGLFYIIFFAFMGRMMELAAPQEFGRMAGLFGGALGVIAAFFLAVFYAVFGSLMTAFLVGIYNLLARGFGGIELQLEAQSPPVQQSPPLPPAAVDWE
jgi:hypothetical protein